MSDVLTILLAGGKGTRLEPLTRDRAKPAVPFAGMYRIVDFALSNCINSRLFNILVLTQYKSLSLEHHVTQGWSRFFHPEFRQSLTIAPPQQRVTEDWYLGTANAVYQNLYSVERSGAEYVLVLAADHVYKMDYRRLLTFHREHGGPATMATLRVPLAEAAGQFGVVEVDPDARVTGFQEKPEVPTPVPGDNENCLASLGIYVFTARFLIDELRKNAECADPGHDFGHHILPQIMGREPIRAFTFSGRGTGAHGYWRDVGTVDAYYQANMDLLADPPGLDLYDRTWPIYSFQPGSPPPRVAVVPEPPDRPSTGARHNIFANGAVSAGWVRGSVIGFDCRIGAGAVVEDSILFDRVMVGPGAEVRRAILDKGVQVLPGGRVGCDADEDRSRGFGVSEGGVTCVAKDTIVNGPT
ncbi:NTP transferase domain-containing protein [Gemmata sp. G18]|uniref:Glucose-1-phosphate adenylyltransferase n=1 Tax=Gemmata palustris TaxID=2822762 RepID=A0ABS5C1Q7_9BACT|nr:sugar phosphate nucleotidyltransferase [Gemmata palustris]MBP3959853.1 NTP transferase domain-containing protein [Gemmata palustris]